MDILSDVLRTVRLQSAVFFNVRAGDTILAMTPHMDEVGHLVMPGADQVIPFHIMLYGDCLVESMGTGEPPVKFEKGDFLFYPKGDPHIFVSELGQRDDPAIENYCRSRYEHIPVDCFMVNEGKPRMHIVCGYLACDARPFNPLLEALPAQVLAKAPPEGNPVEMELIAEAVRETSSEEAGSETVLARLSELLFVRVLRRYIDQLPGDERNWLSSLKDPIVHRALQLMHHRPSEEWTLENLAQESGTSRAVLAERFAVRVGETPIRYLSRWRMQLAARMLQDSNASVATVAESVGYQSEAAFQRAFKKIVGIPPGEWRRNAA